MKTYPSRILALILSVLSFTFVSHAAENASNLPDKAVTDDFSRKFDLYWTDKNFIIHRNDQELPTMTTGNYSRDTLFADGNYVESTFRLNAVGGNTFGLSFRGNQYDSYDSKFLIDGDALYYARCLKERFDPARNKNGCVIFALFQNNQEIDRSEYFDSLGLPPFDLRFIEQGRLFYEKQLDKNRVETLVFDRKLRKINLFRPEIFDTSAPNDLLGILPDGTIVYQTSSGSVEANNVDVKLLHLDVSSKASNQIIDLGNSIGAGGGLAIGNHYYFRTGSDQTSLLRDDIQVALQNSHVSGRIIDASREACSLDATINTYRSRMICIHPSGAIVRIDSASAEAGKQLGGIGKPDDQTELFINEKPLFFAGIRYLLAPDQSTQSKIEQVSVAFNEAGGVEFVLFWLHGNSPWKDSIYISRYTNDVGLGTPILLKDDAQLFGVLTKKR